MSQMITKEITPPELIKSSRTTILVWAMIFPTLMALISFVVVPGLGRMDQPLQQITIWSGKFVQFGLPLWFVFGVRLYWRDRSPLPWRSWLWGIAFGVIVGGGLIALYYLFLQNHSLMEEGASRLHRYLIQANLASPAGFLSLGLFTAVVHSFLEEYYWRWFVFGELQRLWSTTSALVFSSLAFMSYHVILLWNFFPEQIFTAVLPVSLAIACGGVLWAWIYSWERSLFAVWVSHLLVDGALVFVEYQMLAGYW